MNFRFSFRTLNSQLAFLLILVVLLPLGFFGFMTYQVGSDALEDELGQRLVTVARLTAMQFEKENFKALVEKGEALRMMSERLKVQAHEAGVKEIMLLAPDKSVLVDSAGRVPFGGDYVLIKLDLAEWSLAAGGKPVSSPLFTGFDGQLYKSAYAPVRDGRGRLKAMVRAEASAAFLSVVRRFGEALVAMGVLSLALALGLAAWITRPLMKPVRGLIQAAEAVAHGDFKQRVEVSRQDEIGRLASTFNGMARQLGEFVRSKERLASLGELSAGVAHEIRNPLAAIEGFAGLLSKKLDAKDPRKEFAEDILNEVRILNRFLTDFLDYARPKQAGFKDTDMRALVQSAWAAAFTGAKGKRWKLVRTGSRDLILHTDADQLRQVLLNLLLNVRDAQSKGGKVEVGMDLRQEEARLWVRDFGPGIPKGDLGKLFTPFHTTKPMGTGLGLAIADKIIKGLEGSIEVESEWGKGSKFTVKLPAHT